MKYLIAGLGNIGPEYENTRHNIGFKVLEELAGSSDASFTLDRHANVAVIKHRGRTLILIKPTTYMNLSGKAIQHWMTAEKIPVENLLVVTDDVSLPFGQIRLRGKGSDGGHNGLKHIQETLGSSRYARLRFGIGNDFPRGKQVEFVLGGWTREEDDLLDERVKTAADAARSFAAIGLTHTMNQFNNK